MSALPKGIITIFQFFAPLFNQKVWRYAEQMLVGSILCQGSRTVTNVLRILGLSNEKRFERYHRVLNRATWSTKQAAKILLGLLINLLPSNFPIIIGVDDTLERRKGKCIATKGRYRDPIRSGDNFNVACYGLKWISMMLIVPLPWSKRAWALPFLTVLAPSKKYNEKQNKTHKTILKWTIQMMLCVARWLNKRHWFLVADGAFCCSHLALYCTKFNVTFVSRFRLDARLFDFVANKRMVGRPSRAGKRLPTLQTLINENQIVWKKTNIKWYGGIKKQVYVSSGTCLWYAAKSLPVAIRWVLTMDPKNPEKIETFFSTDTSMKPKRIVEIFILRWNVEVSIQESRKHLGFETQRQWSEKAISRSTPIILALYSLVCLSAIQLKMQAKQIIETAWYHKNNEATFSDVLAYVRRKIWSKRYFQRSEIDTNIMKLNKNDFNFLINQMVVHL